MGVNRENGQSQGEHDGAGGAVGSFWRVRSFVALGEEGWPRSGGRSGSNCAGQGGRKMSLGLPSQEVGAGLGIGNFPGVKESWL